MGRIICFDSVVEKSINDIFARKDVETGLIIGQSTAQKDIVIRLCPTPEKDVENNLENTSASGSEKKEAAKKKKNGKTDPPKSLELDEVWICQHAKQITRALPGGFDVLGLYIAAPSDVANRLQQKLRQVLFAVYKILGSDQKLSVNSHICDRILLHICTTTHKCICRTYDILDYKSSANPADWKLSSGVPVWHKLQSRLAVDMKHAVKSESNHNHSLFPKQLKSSLMPFFTNISGATALINNIYRDSTEILDAAQEGKKSKKNPQIQLCYDVELLIPLDQNNDESINELYECEIMLTFKGVIQCRAFVHSRATVKEAIQAVKQDIIRNITARCEIHCEDLLVIEEEQEDPVVVYELPKRVFAPLPQSGICVCDYQFHNDSASDSLDAFKELFNLEVQEQDVETSCETSPTTSTLIQPEVIEDRLSEFGDHVSASRNLLYPVASAAVAAVAAGLSYFFLLQEP